MRVRVWLVVGCLGVASVVRAASIPVNTTADELTNNGNCSLREAVKAANDNAAVDGCPQGGADDTILLPAGTYTLSRTGIDEIDSVTGDLNLRHSVSFIGAHADTTIIDGNGTDRIIDTQGGTVALSHLTLRHGNASTSSQPFGGAIYSIGTTLSLTDCTIEGNTAINGGGMFVELGTVTLTRVQFQGNESTQIGAGIDVRECALSVIDSSFDGNHAGDTGGGFNTTGTSAFAVDVTRSTFSNNTARSGGGISNGNHCALTVRNSTFSGNIVTNSGGGIEQNHGDPMTLSNVTIAGNTANDGGGVMINTGTLAIRNTIIADNAGNNSGPDCYGPLTTQGHNLLESTTDCTFTAATGDHTGVDPLLGPLAFYGGSTLTRSITPASPAFDAGSPLTPGGDAPACEATDQRTTTRPLGAACDIGAFEATPPTTTTTTVSPTTTTTLPSAFCTNGVTITKAKLTVTHAAAPSGDEKLTFAGTLALPTTAGAPTTDGLQVRIADTGNGTVVFDLTGARAIPGGAPGSGCGAKDGWKGKKYTNRSGAVGPQCPAGSALGVRTINVTDKRAKNKGLRLTLTAPGAGIAPPVGPLTATVAIGTGATIDAACGTITFAPAQCRTKGKSYRCR